MQVCEVAQDVCPSTISSEAREPTRGWGPALMDPTVSAEAEKSAENARTVRRSSELTWNPGIFIDDSPVPPLSLGQRQTLV